IPQKTKTELGREARKAAGLSPRLVGALMLVIAAGMVLTSLLVRGSSDAKDLGAQALFWVGTVVLIAVPPGLALAYWLYRKRIRTPSPGVRPPDAGFREAHPTADEQTDAVRELQRGRQREGDENLKLD